MRRYAVITMVHNGGFFVPLWLNYYRKYLRDEDIYIIDHGSNDGSITKEIRKRHNVIDVPFRGFAKGDFLVQHITLMHKKLEQSGKYHYIIYNDIDEIIIADPAYFLNFVAYLDQADGDHLCGHTRSPVQLKEEPPIDFNKPILSQRKQWISEKNFEKHSINKTTPFWTIGFHWIFDPEFDYMNTDYRNWHKSRYNHKLLPKEPDERIFLLHLERIDIGLLNKKRIKDKKVNNTTEMQWRHKLLDQNEFTDWFYGTGEYMINGIGSRPRGDIPERFKNII